MPGTEVLSQLLRTMEPQCVDGAYVFCSVSGSLANYVHLDPLATCQEKEGLTLLLSRSQADQAGLSYDGVFKQITLTAHSSLQAVGLTAAIATQLASHGISANVVAAYYHDHVFVPEDMAEQALDALIELSKSTSSHRL